MRITKIKIKGYRAHESIEICTDKYTALVGPNGCGKSSVLYALDWFFNDRPLNEHDIFTTPGNNTPQLDEISVEVEFTGLTARDRRILGEYGRRETVQFRKTWNAESAKAKFIGNALQGPDFSKVRLEKSLPSKRTAYNALRASGIALPEIERLAKVEDIHSNLMEWEANPLNGNLLVEVTDSDANHMFGFNGINAMAECVRLVLIPAGNDLASDIGEVGKGNPLAALIGAFVTDAGKDAKDVWIENNKESLDQLHRDVVEGVASNTERATQLVNDSLRTYVPHANVKFTPTVLPVIPKLDTSVTTLVTVDGVEADVARQGHGVQRAVMMSILQAMTAAGSVEYGDPEGNSAESTGPLTIFCIEEPEIYQHPARARAFAQALTNLSQQIDKQVLLATHSPYFVRPEQFTNLRRIRLYNGRAKVTRSDRSAVANGLGKTLDKVEKQVQQWFPGSFSEGFFAEAVVLVEGITDQVVLEVVSEKLGKSLAASGISVIPVDGKASFPMAFEILASTGVPVYTVFDADYDPDYADPAKLVSIQSRFDSHKSATETVTNMAKRLITMHPPEDYMFGDDTLSTISFTAFHRDVEEELENWGTFMHELTQTHRGQLRTSKHAQKYRAACYSASVSDIPKSLVNCIDSILAFAALPERPRI